MLPSHYREINPRSNRYADIMWRLRIYGHWDISTSIAFNELTSEDANYSPDREFVLALLERAMRVSTTEHDGHLQDVAHDSWIYDLEEPRPTFAEYLELLKRLSPRCMFCVLSHVPRTRLCTINRVKQWR